jgi:uncharacterized protein
MPTPKKIPVSVAKKLGNYVYLYVDPRDQRIFYVGKGKGQRALAHLTAPEEKAVSTVIEGIRDAGLEPQIEILIHGLPSGEVALQVEAAVIDLLDISTLANEVRGWGSRSYGRLPIHDLVAQYQHKQVQIEEPSILIRINKNFRYGMTSADLYDATRASWKVGRKRREAVQLAFAVSHGVIREVYSVADWFPAGSTFNGRFENGQDLRSERWEFVGAIANDSIRSKYHNGYIGHIFTQGAQNPISYVNVD